MGPCLPPTSGGLSADTYPQVRGSEPQELEAVRSGRRRGRGAMGPASKAPGRHNHPIPGERTPRRPRIRLYMPRCGSPMELETPSGSGLERAPGIDLVTETPNPQGHAASRPRPSQSGRQARRCASWRADLRVKPGHPHPGPYRRLLGGRPHRFQTAGGKTCRSTRGLFTNALSFPVRRWLTERTSWWWLRR